MVPWAGCPHQAGPRQGGETEVLDAGPGSCKMFHVVRKFVVWVFFGFFFGWCLTSQSTAMVLSGWSVHLTTLFPCAGLIKRLTSTFCTYFPL